MHRHRRAAAAPEAPGGASPHEPTGRRRRRRGARGQTLVEFALVFPIFVVMLLGLVEFAFVFNAVLSVNYAARDAALSAAEAGNIVGADCVILEAVEDAVDAPANDVRVQNVHIYEASGTGVLIGAPTIYLRTGSTTCTFVDGTTATVPYTLSQNGYPEANRCNVLAGCTGTGTDTVDNIGVRVTYTHPWITPVRNFIGGGPGGITFERSSVMRMEPIL